MKSSKPGNREKPVGESSAGQPPVDRYGMPSPGDASSASPQVPPVQSGSQYGGYGQNDVAFGRDSGSSSDEGGQGSSQDVNPAEPPVHAPGSGGVENGRRKRPEADAAGKERLSGRGRSGGQADGPTGLKSNQR